MFLPHITDDGRAVATEYLPAGAIQPKVGLALIMTAGLLAVATAADTPAYICLKESDEPNAEGEVIPVSRVNKDIIFETTASEDISEIKPGDKVNISADGLEVTATTGGAAEVVSFDGTEAGSVVRVRF